MSTGKYTHSTTTHTGTICYSVEKYWTKCCTQSPCNSAFLAQIWKHHGHGKSYSTCDWICLKLGFREKKNHNLNRFSSALLYKLHWSHIIRPLVEWLDNLHWISDWLSFAKGLRLNRQLHDNLNCASGNYAKKIKSRKSEDKKNKKTLTWNPSPIWNTTVLCSSVPIVT